MNDQELIKYAEQWETSAKRAQEHWYKVERDYHAAYDIAQAGKMDSGEFEKIRVDYLNNREQYKAFVSQYHAFWDDNASLRQSFAMSGHVFADAPSDLATIFNAPDVQTPAPLVIAASEKEMLQELVNFEQEAAEAHIAPEEDEAWQTELLNQMEQARAEGVQNALDELAGAEQQNVLEDATWQSRWDDFEQIAPLPEEGEIVVETREADDDWQRDLLTSLAGLEVQETGVLHEEKIIAEEEGQSEDFVTDVVIPEIAEEEVVDEPVEEVTLEEVEDAVFYASEEVVLEPEVVTPEAMASTEEIDEDLIRDLDVSPISYEDIAEDTIAEEAEILIPEENEEEPATVFEEAIAEAPIEPTTVEENEAVEDTQSEEDLNDVPWIDVPDDYLTRSPWDVYDAPVGSSVPWITAYSGPIDDVVPIAKRSVDPFEGNIVEMPFLAAGTDEVPVKKERAKKVRPVRTRRTWNMPWKFHAMAQTSQTEVLARPSWFACINAQLATSLCLAPLVIFPASLLMTRASETASLTHASALFLTLVIAVIASLAGAMIAGWVFERIVPRLTKNKWNMSFANGAMLTFLTTTAALLWKQGVGSFSFWGCVVWGLTLVLGAVLVRLFAGMSDNEKKIAWQPYQITAIAVCALGMIMIGHYNGGTPFGVKQVQATSLSSQDQAEMTRTGFNVQNVATSLSVNLDNDMTRANQTYTTLLGSSFSNHIMAKSFYVVAPKSTLWIGRFDTSSAASKAFSQMTPRTQTIPMRFASMDRASAQTTVKEVGHKLISMTNSTAQFDNYVYRLTTTDTTTQASAMHTQAVGTARNTEILQTIDAEIAR